MTAQGRFRAMGTRCHVLVNAPAPQAQQLVDLAQNRVELLEQCWSRFRSTSELSTLNERAGTGAVAVSDDLHTLVSHMQRAWAETDGLFDPTVLTAMRAWGYDDDFATVAARTAVTAAVAATSAPGMAQVRITDDAVSLPAGVGLDPGAIGKGLAADLIATDLLAAGATGVLVNLGGDIALGGEPIADPDTDASWHITIDDERSPDTVLETIALPAPLAHAGIATSTTLTRRWAQGRRHHVIDPRTGAMGADDLVQVTVVAAQAWWAEAAATAALLMPSDTARAWLTERGLSGILLTADDRIGVGSLEVTA